MAHDEITRLAREYAAQFPEANRQKAEGAASGLLTWLTATHSVVRNKDIKDLFDRRATVVDNPGRHDRILRHEASVEMRMLESIFGKEIFRNSDGVRARIKGTDKTVRVKEVYHEGDPNPSWMAPDGARYMDDDLDFDIPDPALGQAFVQGYVTRDSDGRLSLFLNRPVRNIYGFWQSSKFREREHELPESAFPALTWDDEPVAVEVLISGKFATNTSSNHL